MGAVDFVTITHVSAIGNVMDGIRLPYVEQVQQELAAAALGPVMTGYITGVLAMGNGVGIEFNDDTPNGIPAGSQYVAGAVAGAVGTVTGSIICDNTSCGAGCDGLHLAHV